MDFAASYHRAARQPRSHVALCAVTAEFDYIKAGWNGACCPFQVCAPLSPHLSWTFVMSYQDIDREIAHLEVVFNALSARDRFPLSYWHRRLHALNRSSMVPAQRQRVAHLEARLRSVGAQLDQLAGAARRGSRASPRKDRSAVRSAR
ncbi:hypothetical protein [Paraburkholderia sp. BR14374]|uniref:hypothetical protein n=1 Tax=Paraburkholderia sp. BR14374 TaxID=3237007 RepID=UPI0034CF98E9